MKILKGFVTINQYINNVPGVVSLIGELSTWSTTYSINKGEYQDATIPGYKLTSFQNKDSDTGVETVINQAQVLQILQVIKEIVTYANSNIRPYNTENFKNSILVTLGGTISNLTFGNFIDTGTVALPEWVNWKNVDSNYDDIKIWLADSSFIDQYDDYRILVIPPIVNLNALFGSYVQASETINERTLSELTEMITVAKEENPETYIRTYEFYYHNPNITTQKIVTNWTAIIYGKAGDNPDAIKDAMVDYVLANSAHDRAEWEVIVPELMKRTEFVILPRWDLISIPNLTEISSLYGNLLDPAECITFAKTNTPFYPEAFVATNVTMMPYDYKAICLLIVNGYTNIDEKVDIKQIFPDYIPVSTSTIDFNRMGIHTKNWVILLEELLIEAEKATRFTSVPHDFRRIERNGIIYISKIYDNVNYLVAARSNNFYSV